MRASLAADRLRPPQPGHSKRLKRVDGFRSLLVIAEPEVADGDVIRRKVGDDKTVLLDRLQILFHLKMAGYRSADATEYRRPASIACSQRSGQNHGNRVLSEIQRAAADHAALGDRVKVAAYDQGDPTRHRRDAFPQ